MRLDLSSLDPLLWPRVYKSRRKLKKWRDTRKRKMGKPEWGDYVSPTCPDGRGVFLPGWRLNFGTNGNALAIDKLFCSEGRGWLSSHHWYAARFKR